MSETAARSRYWVRQAGEGDPSVELWSSRALPFEPSGWLWDMREKLRVAIAQIRPREDGLLHATYTTRELTGADLDNVLAYNVGARYFRHLCAEGLYLERRIGLPPEPPLSHRHEWGHHCRYAVVTREPMPRDWSTPMTLAEWLDIPIPPIRQDTKLSHLWHAFKRHTPAVYAPRARTGELAYGLRIEIRTPDPVNLAAIVKPLVDGIVCALHNHAGKDEQERRTVAERLAGQLSTTPETVLGILENDTCAILGPRRLLWPRADGIQWNPDDHRCVLIGVTASQSHRTQWCVSASVSAMSEAWH